MKNKKKKLASVTGAVAVLCLTASTLALFTDRYQSQAEVTTGSLELALRESWQADNAALAAAYKPGTGLKLDYVLDNEGNMAANVRENFVICTDKAISAGADREFDLYAAQDAELDPDGNVINISGEPLEPVYGSYSDDAGQHYTLSYALDEIILNGNGADAEIVNNGLDVLDGKYVLVFNVDAGNDFQNVDLDIEYMAQALQNSHTGEDTWADAKVISEKISFGGQEMNVVPTVEEQGGM